MKMTYESLIKQGRIKPYNARPEEIQQLLKVASRDLAAAARNLEDAPDWAYTMVYNAILQTSRALMLGEGYRPRGSDQHATVVEFIQEKLGFALAEQVSLFDQMRRKRHRVIYEVAGLISKREAKQAIEFANSFVVRLTEAISRQPGLGV
jgi:uncharacterized protein (UPF0332 family)